MHFVTRSLGRLRPAFLCAVVCGALSPRLDAQTPVPPAPDSVPLRSVGVLRPGDLLKVSVYRNKELSGDYLIDSRGNVQIPGLGAVRAAGLDPIEVTARIQSAVAEQGFEHPQVAVQPLIRVSVLGAVRSPSLYPIDPGTSLIQLLTIAGGPVDADLRKTRVVRDGRAFTVDLESALAGSAAGRVVLYSNDVVVIPHRSGFTAQTFTLALSTLTTLLSLVNLIVILRRR